MKFKIAFTLILCALFVQGQSQKLSSLQLSDSIDQLRIEKDIPGAFVIVVSKDSVLFQEVFGKGDIEKSIDVNENHLFRIASITKTFTAMAIMKLVQDGKLSLEDKLSELAPEIPFENDWEESHPIRIKHLLVHKAGFEDMRFSTMVNKNEVADSRLDEVLSFKNSFTCEWKPGLVTSYSNPGYIILGYLIEKISGQTSQDYIKATILEPLGLQDTKFSSEVVTNDDLIATGYRFGEIGLEVAEKPKHMSLETASGLLSSVTDMGLFLQYFLNEKLQDSLPLIGRKGVLEMETLHGDIETTNNIKTGYSLGLEDRMFGQNEILFKGNSGLTDGFVTNFIYNRKLNIGIAISSNLFGVGHQSILDVLVDSFAPFDINDAPVYKEKTIDIETFKDWEGEHRELNDTQEVFNFLNFPLRTKNLRFEGNHLVISEIENDPETFVYVGGNAFMDMANGEKVPQVYLTEYEGEKSLHYYDSTFLSTSSLAYFLLRVLLMLSLLLPIIATLLLIVQFVKAILKKPFKKVFYRLLLLIAPFWILIISLLLTLQNLSYDKISTIATLNPVSISIFLCSLLFPLFGLFGWYYIYREWAVLKKISSKLLYSLLVFGNMFLSTYCIYMGWFALRFWAY